MAAAAHGRSNLGIPAKVGREFLDADRGRGKQFTLAHERREKRTGKKDRADRMEKGEKAT